MQSSIFFKLPVLALLFVSVKMSAFFCADGGPKNGTNCAGLPNQNYYIDSDQDGFGSQNAQPINACLPPGQNYVPNNLDCDDSNPNIKPTATEVCDGLDNDCNGTVDGFTRACYAGPGGTSGVGICSPGIQVCTGGAWGECFGDVLPKAEICNGLDDDCNGQPDNGCAPNNLPGANITLDGSALSHKFLVLNNAAGTAILPVSPDPKDFGTWFFSKKQVAFNLPDGVFTVYAQSGVVAAFNFEIKNGVVKYAAAHENFLGGQGTATLKLKGLKVNLDARFIIGKGVCMVSVFGLENSPCEPLEFFNLKENVYLLPANGYILGAGSGLVCGFNFNLTVAGKITFATDCNKFLDGNNTPTLTLVGFTVLVDARANAPSNVPANFPAIWGPETVDNHSPKAAGMVVLGNFLPLQTSDGYKLNLPNSGQPSAHFFKLDKTGAVTVSDPTFLKTSTVNGTRTVAVLKKLN